MNQNSETFQFWNDTDTAQYFKTKKADPRLIEIVASLGDTVGKRALDLGCGGGRHSEFLVKQGYIVSAVDINPTMIAITEDRINKIGKTIDIRYGSILNIPYPDDEFDLVITTGVLHQSQNQVQYIDSINELYRVIKPGGLVFLNIFTNTAWDSTYTKTNDDHVVITKEGLLMTLLPKDIFISYMANAGFRVVIDYGEDIKSENTGIRSIFRAIFAK